MDVERLADALYEAGFTIGAEPVRVEDMELLADLYARLEQDHASALPYQTWVERMAVALHEDCLLYRQAVAVADPKRQITMHEADAHWGKAHDLVRRLALAALPPEHAVRGMTGEADRDRYGVFMGAALSGSRSVQRAVADEVTKDEMALRIRALGGSPVDIEEALALVRAKLEASQTRPTHYAIQDACDEVLRPWMTGEKRGLNIEFAPVIR